MGSQPVQAGQQQVNFAALQGTAAAMLPSLPPGTQLVKLPNGQIALMSNQQIQQLLQAQFAANGGVAAAQHPAAQLAVSALQQRLQANPAVGQQQVQQAQLLAAKNLVQQQPAVASTAVAGRAVTVPTGPPVKVTNNFTDDQLTTLREQIVLFKCIKKNTAPVSKQDVENCKPKPLPVQLLAPALTPAAQQPAAVAAATARPGMGAVNAAALQQQQQQQLRPQANAAAASLAAQQQQLQRASLAAAAAAAQRPAAAAQTAAGRPGQRADGAAAGQQQQQQQQPQELLGPTTPPMEVPVRRYAGPLLGMLPPQEVQRELL